MYNDMHNNLHNQSPASEPVFRPMGLGDIEVICQIELEAFATPWTADAFNNELVNNHFARYMVMEIDGEIAGYGGMWTIVDEAHITNIAVRQDFRGHKLGSRLLSELQNTAVSLGMLKMTLEVRVSNFVAISLYEKHGFQAAGVRRRYYADNNEDALIMWAELPVYNEIEPDLIERDRT